LYEKEIKATTLQSMESQTQIQDCGFGSMFTSSDSSASTSPIDLVTQILNDDSDRAGSHWRFSDDDDDQQVDILWISSDLLEPILRSRVTTPVL
jgi:hypothetical protein